MRAVLPKKNDRPARVTCASPVRRQEMTPRRDSWLPFNAFPVAQTMGADPSFCALHGETRIASGAETHFRRRSRSNTLRANGPRNETYLRWGSGVLPAYPDAARDAVSSPARRSAGRGRRTGYL